MKQTGISFSLGSILLRVQEFPGEKLVGWYLYDLPFGEDFDYEISDVE